MFCAGDPILAGIPVMRDFLTFGRIWTSRIGRDNGSVSQGEAHVTEASSNKGKSRRILVQRKESNLKQRETDIANIMDNRMVKTPHFGRWLRPPDRLTTNSMKLLRR